MGMIVLSLSLTCSRVHRTPKASVAVSGTVLYLARWTQSDHEPGPRVSISLDFLPRVHHVSDRDLWDRDRMGRADVAVSPRRLVAGLGDRHDLL
jgi:hypothetical protein